MPPQCFPGVAGVLLAAGAGSRYGFPKALVPGWLPDRVHALGEGGCEPVVVVLGAAAGRARALVPTGARAVVSTGWTGGMGESLRAGLDAVEGDDVGAVLVALVDTPGLTPAAVGRLVHRAGAQGQLETVLAQASYGGSPAHPVLLGRSHWDGIRAVATGDRGARDYLAARAVEQVECGDVADGRDVDVPCEEAAATVAGRGTAPVLPTGDRDSAARRPAGPSTRGSDRA